MLELELLPPHPATAKTAARSPATMERCGMPMPTPNYPITAVSPGAGIRCAAERAVHTGRGPGLLRMT